MEFIRLIHSFGSINEEHQKFVILAMTVFSNCNLPAKDRDFTLQEEIRLFTLSSRGAQLAIDNLE